MSSFEPEPRTGSRRSELIWLGTQIVFAASTLLALVITVSDRISIDSSVGLVFVGIFFIGLYTLGVYIFVRRLRQIKRYQFRIAVTGLPQAGKTVFSILLFDALMNERVPGVDFSAESRALISVYQAIRNLPAQAWPRSTARGNISTYEGTINARRTKIDLEVGDSAGEYWLDFSDSEVRDPGYLEYVVSAHGIAHVIPADDLLSEDGVAMLEREVEDLRLAARLKQQARGATSAVPLLIVLSKADLIAPVSVLRAPDAGLLQVVTDEGLQSLGLLDSLDSEYSAPSLIERLRTLSRNVSRDFSSVHFVFSSAPAIAEGRLRVEERSGDLVRWIMRQAMREVHRGILSLFWRDVARESSPSEPPRR